jgi:hypothetical protein
MKQIILLFLSLLSLNSCNQIVTPETTIGGLRWMDRSIYLAFSDPKDSDRNNIIQKSKVKEALSDLQNMTSLGEGYFGFSEVDESTLNTSLDGGSSSDQKSFILVWPDSVFNNYLATVVNGQTPDPNAIAVLNDSNKRKFFIIVRASCISSSAQGSCSGLGFPGFKALIARQMGLLVGMATKKCSDPNYQFDIMCATNPNDGQYSDNSKLRFSGGFNNALEAIRINPSFYVQ